MFVPFSESSRCSKKCSFPELTLNSSIPSDFCPSSNESNNDINQVCEVKLTIDFPTGFVNGSFDVKNQSSSSENHLDITTIFSLNDTSIKIDIIYLCFMFDYCDLQFMHETLSPALAAFQMEPIRQKLAIRLYNPNNTDPVKCLGNIRCSQNVSLCDGRYIPPDEVYPEDYYIVNKCAAPNAKPEVSWKKYYLSNERRKPIELELNCNTPKCSSNVSVIDTFKWLAREYVLPVNAPMFDITTTPKPITMATLPTRTTPNYASSLFGHFNYLISFFLTILVFALNFSDML